MGDSYEGIGIPVEEAPANPYAGVGVPVMDSYAGVGIPVEGLPSTASDITALGAVVRPIAEEVLPAAGGAAGVFAGAGVGAALGGLVGIETGPGALATAAIGGIVGAVVGEAGVAKLQHWAMTQIMGEDWIKQQQAEDVAGAQAHPFASGLGQMVGQVPMLLTGEGLAEKAVAAGFKSAMVSRVIQSGIMGAQFMGGQAGMEKAGGAPGSEEISIPGEIVKGFAIMGPLGIMGPAATSLGKYLGRPASDAAVLALANNAYDTVVRGKPFSVSDTIKQAGENLPAFAIMGAFQALTHHTGTPVDTAKVAALQAEKDAITNELNIKSDGPGQKQATPEQVERMAAIDTELAKVKDSPAGAHPVVDQAQAKIQETAFEDHAARLEKSMAELEQRMQDPTVEAGMVEELQAQYDSMMNAAAEARDRAAEIRQQQADAELRDTERQAAQVHGEEIAENAEALRQAEANKDAPLQEAIAERIKNLQPEPISPAAPEGEVPTTTAKATETPLGAGGVSPRDAGKALRALVAKDRQLVDELGVNSPMEAELSEDGTRLIQEVDTRNRGHGTGKKYGATTEFINWLMSDKVGEGISGDDLAEHMASVERARGIIRNAFGIKQPPPAPAPDMGQAAAATEAARAEQETRQGKLFEGRTTEPVKPMSVLEAIERGVKIKPPAGATHFKITPKGGVEQPAQKVSDLDSWAKKLSGRDVDKIVWGYLKGGKGAFVPMEGAEGKVVPPYPAEQWADTKIKEARGRMNLGVDPELMAAYAVKGAAILSRGVRDFAAWSAEMVKQFTDAIKPFLQDIFKKSQEMDARAMQEEGKTGTRLGDIISEKIQRETEVAKGVIKNIVNSMPTDREIAQRYDAAQNQPVVAGEQARNSITLISTPAEQKAAFVVVEAGREISRLDDFEALVQKGIDRWKAEKRTPPSKLQDMLATIRYTRNHWNGMQPVADKAEGIYAGQLASELQAGIDTPEVENYAGQHLYDNDTWMGRGRPYILGGNGGTGLGTSFKKGRTFPTVFDAIAEGYIPKTINIAALAEHRVKVGQKLIAAREWVNAMRGMTDPTDGKPVITDLIKTKVLAGVDEETGEPKFKDQETKPMGYEMRDIIPGVRVAVHESYAKLIDALTGESTIPKAPISIAGVIKHGLLLFDTFHASRIAQRMFFLTGKVSYRKGNSILEYSDVDLAQAVTNNEMTQEMADFVKANRADAELFLKSGLNVGRIQELLYSSMTRDVQQALREAAEKAGVSKPIGEKLEFNKWVFDKVTRGAMMESALIELERLQKLHPEIPKQQLVMQISRDINQMFGNIGRQGLFKSRSGLDMARLVGLAPQWVESMARTELRGYGQIAGSIAKGQSPLSETMGRGIGTGLLAYFAATQLLNLVTRHQPTWDNPEKEHKFDAWIPDITGKTNGFFLSPFGVVAELTHDMIRYEESEGNPLDAAVRIMSNKVSPFFRSGQVLLTGYNPNHEKIRDLWRRVQESALALAPVPIPLSATIKGSDYPGQTQRQLTASLGFKTELAMSNTTRMHRLADEYNQARGKPPGPDMVRYEGEGYGPLALSLRREDDSASLEHLTDLRQTEPDSKILAHFKRSITAPYTGSTEEEEKFVAGLGDADKTTYAAAKVDKQAAYDRLARIMQSNPRRDIGRTGTPKAKAAVAKFRGSVKTRRGKKGRKKKGEKTP